MLSPTIGQPISAACTRSWWVRPVTGSIASQVNSTTPRALSAPSPLVGEGWGGGADIAVDPHASTSFPTPDPSPQGGGEKRPSTFHVVVEGSPAGSGFIHQPRVSSRLPSGNSIRPSSASGPPSTTA